MNTLFDSAGLAIVAYADVLTDGTSPTVNSGIKTAKVPATVGQYTITLPAGTVQSPPAGETAPRDLVFVQPVQTPLNNGILCSKVDPVVTLNSDGSGTFHVAIVDASTFADGAFDILVLRTILPTPSNPSGPT
jgi:hypothetical protein